MGGGEREREKTYQSARSREGKMSYPLHSRKGCGVRWMAVMSVGIKEGGRGEGGEGKGEETGEERGRREEKRGYERILVIIRPSAPTLLTTVW